jgi:predicted nuclease with TOPRIM domain
MLVKKQGLFESKTGLTDYNVATIRQDLGEVKGDVKELRKEQQEIINQTGELKGLITRVERVESVLDDHDKRHWPRVEDALRRLDVLQYKVENIQDTLHDTFRSRRQDKQKDSTMDNKGAV